MITVQPFADEAEAIAMANGVEFGLASSVWTADHGRALRCARAFDFGCVRQHGHSPPPFLPWQCRARLMRLLRVRLVAPGASRHPGREARPLGAHSHRLRCSGQLSLNLGDSTTFGHLGVD